MLLAEDTIHGGRPNLTNLEIGNEPATLAPTTTADSIPIHPLGVKPLGNQYFASGPNARHSLRAMGRLPDEMILHLLEYLDAESLVNFASTCRFLYAFGELDELWKSLFLESQRAPGEDSFWRGSWKATYFGLPNDMQLQIDCGNVFSDVLHRPFSCAHIDLTNYASTIPVATNISRLDKLTYDEFAQDWSNKPFILTQCIQSWPVCKEWTIQELCRQYSDVEFRAEAVDWPFSAYNEYMAKSDRDESPLYLFDRAFAEKMRLGIGSSQTNSSYWPPECFGPDLFEVLSAERPAHRWLIVGPARSGSTFHKDPNATSAWNAVIEGAKYWIMFPPATQVPGVYVSEDSSEVTSPLSIAEWLLEFHAEARQVPGCIEGVCKAGEILHVPSGWWHLVVNLEAGIALTQNFVPKSHLVDALLFLKDKPDQVTGFQRNIESPFDLFTQRLEDHYPLLLQNALEEIERKSQSKKRKWEEAVGTKHETADEGGGFSFGFATESDEEIP
ncbi:hypothetical protein F5Y18DRAFT_395507 [Xylariaceae sp. FL1019]|nr:hypothetical protein F5Y18DRAFT_395507 [Xylariaceae sp. FL1019]